ncbi:MAG: SLC13 family permease [Clostridia bacterium]|nr:SLC13 family permease [Clostridia bacterium]
MAKAAAEKATTNKEEEVKKNPMIKKYIWEIVAIIIALVISFMEPPAGLTSESMIVLGIAIWAIINWVIRLFDEYVTCFVMAIGWYVLANVELGAIFSGFSGSTFWLLISVVGLGAAVSASGLLKRISILLLKFFKPTYVGQILAFALAGAIISPLIPSTTAKMAIMSPLALGIANELGLTKRGAGRAGLLVALWLGVNISGNFFINASFQGFMVLGLLPEASQSTYTWMNWFLRSLPWTIVMMVMFLGFILFAYKEKGANIITKDYINDRLKEAGPMTRDEKIVALVMAGCLLMFILEAHIGFSSMSTAVLGFSILLMTKVIGAKEFQNNMMWPMMFFIGFTLGMGDVFGAVGLTDWLGHVLSPLAASLSNPYMFVAVLALITYVVRILIPQVPSNILMITLLYPLAVQLGMDPWVAAVVIYGASVVFYPLYVHPNMLIGYTQAGADEYINVNSLLKANIAYMIINIIGFWACIPFWKMLGMM